MPLEAVISAPDAKSIYQVPIFLEEQGLTDYLLKRMKLQLKPDGLTEWKGFLNKVMNPSHEIKILLVGKYMDQRDSYMSHYEAFTHAGAELDTRVEFLRMEAEDLEKGEGRGMLEEADGILIPGGFGTRGVEGKIMAIKYARENKVPFLGVCLGFQLANVEFARNVMGMHDANSTEFDPHTTHPVIDFLPEQKNVTKQGRDHEARGPGGPHREGLEGRGALRRHDHHGETQAQVRGQPALHRHDPGEGVQVHGEVARTARRWRSRSWTGIRTSSGRSSTRSSSRGRGSPAPLHYGLVKAAIEHSKKTKE